MKKMAKWIAMLMAVMMLSACGRSEPDYTDSQLEQATQALKGDPVFESYHWGDSLADVQSAEADEPISASGSMLLYSGAELDGVSVSKLFLFNETEDALNSAGYLFNAPQGAQEADYRAAYEQFVAYYTQQYGEPTEGQILESSQVSEAKRWYMTDGVNKIECRLDCSSDSWSVSVMYTKVANTTADSEASSTNE